MTKSIMPKRGKGGSCQTASKSKKRPNKDFNNCENILSILNSLNIISVEDYNIGTKLSLLHYHIYGNFHAHAINYEMLAQQNLNGKTTRSHNKIIDFLSKAPPLLNTKLRDKIEEVYLKLRKHIMKIDPLVWKEVEKVVIYSEIPSWFFDEKRNMSYCYRHNEFVYVPSSIKTKGRVRLKKGLKILSAFFDNELDI